ncbi:MAG: AMP-binding protein [Sinobacteraceae bacterium]|nr:AMP-binding protein [Nevskiaceae bacterium]
MSWMTARSESLRDVRIQVTTLGDLLLGAADRYPDSPALILPEQRLSYAELAGRALARARALQALGVSRGEHVGLLLPSCIEFVECLFAIALCGAIAVPLNARYKHNELGYVIENGDLVAVITTDRIADHVNFVERLNLALPSLAGAQGGIPAATAAAAPPARLQLAEAPRLRHLVLLGDSQAPGFLSQPQFEALSEQSDEERVHVSRLRVRLRDVAIMLYTSGTTANPKGCLLTHEAIVRNSIALGRHRYGLRHEDVFWSPLPMFHIAAILPMCAIFDVGGAYATMMYFEAGRALRMLEQERVTATYPCFVTIMSELIYHPDFAKTDLSRITLMNSNFAVQPPDIAAAMLKSLPHATYVGTFGMTETAGTVTTSRLEDPLEQRLQRLGKPLPGLEVRIVDAESGQDAAPGGRGEVLVRGYCLLEGYYKDPHKSAQAIDAQGWYHTGDIGSIDAAGTMMFHGRLKDMLKVGGENVAAAEIESCLQRHEAVKLAQVVGIPDARLVEVAAAFVELKPNASASAETLTEFCRREIAGFKVPRHIRFVSEWPMSSSKIQKFRLRDQLVRELGL